MRVVLQIVIAAWLALTASAAHAFPIGVQFDLDPTTSDGGGGIAFNGSPRWSNHDCSVCHTDPARTVRLRVEADPVDLFTSGYVPNMQYRMRVVMLNEHEAADYAVAGDTCIPQIDQRCDDNGFSLEIDDPSANPQGQFVATAPDGTCGNPTQDSESYVLNGGQAVVHNGLHHGLTSWTFCWTAPDTGTGPVTIYVAAVDGNGGEATTDVPDDTVGDDVVTGALPLLEEGGAPPPPQTGGCTTAPSSGRHTRYGAIVAIMLTTCLAIIRSPRSGRRAKGPRATRSGRRRRRLLLLPLLVAVALGATGCVTVHPWQKEQLADRKMQFGVDPDEAELDLHMQEAREGSAGGYGSAGGGCGCN
jgi:hypothetical protein